MGTHKMSGTDSRGGRGSEREKLRKLNGLLFLVTCSLLWTAATAAPRDLGSNGKLRLEARSSGPRNGDGPEDNIVGDEGEMRPTKRVANSVEFLGQMVSYPQYIRLRRIQAEVINMDKVIRNMLQMYDSETLANFPPWLELIAMYRQMRKMLPDGYIREAEEVEPFDLA